MDLNPFSGRRSTSVKDHRQGEKKLTYKFKIAFIKRPHSLKTLENPFENISGFHILDVVYLSHLLESQRCFYPPLASNLVVAIYIF